MFPEFTVFNVEIKNKVFKGEDGLSYPRTAILNFVSPEEGHHEAVRELGYLEEAEIFGIIKRGDPLVLDHCYIDGFSLTEYRDQAGLGTKDPVPIVGFSSKSAFYNCRGAIDLSYADFTGAGICFTGSLFARGTLSMHGSRIESGGLDFSDTHLPGGHFNLGNLHLGKGDLNFKNAVFKEGFKDFQDAVFGEGNKIFTNTDFGEGDVSFVNSRFGNGDISFKVARFGHGRVDFHYAKFGEGNISFERTEFGEGRVDFRTAEFEKGRINFNRAVFGDGPVTFEASGLKEGKLSFKRTIFGEGILDFELAEYENVDASFERAVFNVGTVSFHQAKFRTLSLNSCHIDHYLDLRVAECRHIDLTDTIVRDIIDLMPYDYDLDVDTINFSGIRMIGRIYIDWKENRVRELIRSQEKSTNRSKAEQFRTLKENFRVTGQYHDEDKAYLEFKRLESITRLEEAIRKRPVSGLWMYPAYWFKLVIFDWVGHYATNPLRVIISMLVMYLLFSVIFMLLILFTPADIVSSVGDPDKLNVVVRSLYHCAITFLTIGYGDFYPSGAIRWFSSLVGFTGLVMVAYFTVAFVRKILR